MKIMRVMPVKGRWLVAVVLMLGGVGLIRPASFSMRDFEKLKPIEGLWVTKRANGDIYEQWAAAGTGRLTGRSYKILQADTVMLETMSLYYQGGEIVFAPVTAGQNDEKEVIFKLASVKATAFTFENLAHDFPQRIVYDLKSHHSLHAYIEGEMDAKKKRIDYPYTRIH